jgi:hypothetical protein
MGQPDEVRELLLECWRYRTLPAEGHLIADPDLASVRDLSWFDRILSLARDDP